MVASKKQSVHERTSNNNNNNKMSILDFEMPMTEQQPARRSSSSSAASLQSNANANNNNALPSSCHLTFQSDNDTTKDCGKLANTSNKRRRAGNKGSDKNLPQKQSSHDTSNDIFSPPLSSSACGTISSNSSSNGPAKKKKKRDTVCYDVTVIKKHPTVKGHGGRNALCCHKDSSAMIAEMNMTQSSVTPSPDMQKNYTTALLLDESSSKDGVCGMDSGITLSTDSIPLNERLELEEEKKKKVNVDTSLQGLGNVEEDVEENAKQQAMLEAKLPVNHSVPIDTFDQQHKTFQQQQQQSTFPAFHHPWIEPYKPALSNDNTSSSLPRNEIIDIDIFPHVCCLNSYQSHAGYSWITSKRRCGCLKDMNHNSAGSMVDAYLGSYGVDRYGMVGLAGVTKRGGRGVMTNISSSNAVNACDWKIEQWWLDQTREQLLLQQQAGVSAASSSSLPPSTSSLSTSCPNTRLVSLLPTSIEKHLDYMERHPGMTLKYRETLMEWLFQVNHEEFKLSTETFWLTVKLVDRSLSCSYSIDNGVSISATKKKKNRKKKWIIGREMALKGDKIQLLGCVCMLIAWKLTEVDGPTIDKFVEVAANQFNHNEIIDMEADVCDALKFNLNFVTPKEYIDRFLRASFASSENSTSTSLSGNQAAMLGASAMNNATNMLVRKLVMYILDLSMMEYRLVTKKTSLVVASAVYLARASLGIREAATSSTPLFELSSVTSGSVTNRSTSPSLQRALRGYWSKTLEYYTGYDKWDLEECVLLLHRLLVKVKDPDDKRKDWKSIYKKHKDVSKRIVVSEDDLGFL